MNRFLLLLCLISVFPSCLVTQNSEQNFDPLVLRAKETSLYSNEIDWQKVNAEYIKLSEGKETVEELKPALQYLINSLGDKHAHIRNAQDFSIVASYQGKRDAMDNRDPSFVNNVVNAPSEFSYMLLEDNIGYLRVVGIGPGDVKQQSDLIRAGLKELKEQGVNQWILDLRINGGGNMEPMICGLAPLIGEGPIGYTVDGNGEILREYLIEGGSFNNWGRIACEMDELPIIDKTEKLVILLSRYTVSSGEMLAITFKGRENTIFMGENSGGYTTGNGYDQVTDDLILLISQDIFADRNKKVYPSMVEVDQYIEFDHRLDLIDDKQIEKAIVWLQEK